MIGRIFYNVIVLGSIISICIFPLLIFLSKNKYKYNFKSIYKIFTIILLMLFLPINTIKFSNIKNLLPKEKQSNNVQILEVPEIKFETQNTIIEVDKDINVKNDTAFNIFQVLPYIWILITISLLGYNVFSYMLFLYKEKKSYLNYKNPTIDNIIEKICNEMQLKNIGYRISENISTPMTIGLFHKKIIISKENLDEKQYEIIFRHELFHIKNKDIEYKFILLVLNCIYWFNPIIYIFKNQIDELLELKCDENVLQNKNKEFRVEYAKTLLNQIELNRNNQYKFSMNFANRRKNIMNRFSNIVNESKKQSVAVIATVTAVLLIVSALIIFLIPNINFATINENFTEEKNNEEYVLVKQEENESENTVSKNNTTTDENVKLTPNTDIENSKSAEELKNEDVKLVSLSNDLGITLVEPLKEYTISKKFGPSVAGTHTGIDLKAEKGDEIYSIADGTVIYAGFKGSYGNTVIIDHGNNVESYYAHCSSLYVSDGQQVTQGQVIATVGSTGQSTGPHLHLEIRVNKDAQDPENYLFK